MSQPRERKSLLRWVLCQGGQVPPGAVPGGWEKDNPVTFIGRVSIRGGTHVGRVVPRRKCCFAVLKAMEHRRKTYEVLVNPDVKRRLRWQRDFAGHVPDTAVALSANSDAEINDGIKDAFYIGRAGIADRDCGGISEMQVVPGYVEPSHGLLHVGYDNTEILREEYEVLCKNEPSSLGYLAGKAVRETIRSCEKIRKQKYSTKIADMFLAIERIVYTVFKKEPRKRESPEEKLELPLSLVSSLQSPRCPGLSALQRLDFNTILDNCCPPEENCSCQIWVEVTLLGLY